MSLLASVFSCRERKPVGDHAFQNEEKTGAIPSALTELADSGKGGRDTCGRASERAVTAARKTRRVRLECCHLLGTKMCYGQANL